MLCATIEQRCCINGVVVGGVDVHGRVRRVQSDLTVYYRSPSDDSGRPDPQIEMQYMLFVPITDAFLTVVLHDEVLGQMRHIESSSGGSGCCGASVGDGIGPGAGTASLCMYGWM